MQKQFRFATAHRLARTTDPSTSKEGAAHIALHITERQQHALNMVKEYPGRTANELDQINGSTDREVGKRLAELLRKGKVRRGVRRECGVTGRPAYTWEMEAQL